MSRLRADLEAMAGVPAGSYVLPNTRATTDNFTLEYDNSGYTTVAWDEYRIAARAGYIVKRSTDEDGNDVDWNALTSYAWYWSGTVVTPSGRYTIVREPLVWYDEQQPTPPIDSENAINLELAYDAIVDTLIAAGGAFTVDERGFAFGDPPPTYDAATDTYSGTGILGNEVRLAGVNTDVLQFYWDVPTGKSIAGNGAVTLDANGISIETTIADTNYLEFKDDTLKVGSVFGTSDTVSTPTNSGITISANWNGDYVVGETRLRALGDSGEVAQFSVSAGYGLNYAQLTLDSVGTGGFTIQKGGSGTNTSLLTLASTAPTLRLEDLTGSAKSLLITVDGNKATFEEVAGTDVMVLDLANARVGIGTASPTSGYKLETSESILVNSSTNNSGFNVIFTGSSSSSAGPQSQWTTNDGAAMASGDRIGTLLFNGYNGSAVVTGAGLVAAATEGWSGSARGSKITFYTTPNGSTSLTAALTLEQNQNVTMPATATVATKLYVNETADANVTIGAILNQGANDDFILTLKSSDVAHVMTGVGEADTYGAMSKVNTARGGLEISGFKESGDATAGNAVRVRGYLGTAANTTHNATGAAVIDLSAAVTDGGTGVTGAAADSNLVSISSNNTIKFLFDSDGDSFEDGTGWTAYDAHDDVALLDRMNRVMLDAPDRIKANFLEWVGLNARELEALNLISIGENSLFINRSKMQELLTGAVRQLGARLDRLEQAQGRLNG